MTRVLVTGGTGTIGRWAVEQLLQSGEEVHVLSRSGAKEASPRASVAHRLHVGDVLDVSTAMSILDRVQPDVLLHLAWETTHGQFWHAPSNETWLLASNSLVRAFGAAGGRRVVAAGTCAEYAWHAGTGPFVERGSPAAPATPYGAAKLALLRSLEQGASRSGTSFAWGRIFSVYGPGEDARRLVPSLILAALRGSPAVVHAPEAVRDYAHARDIGAAFAALCTSTVTGPVNVASGVGTRLDVLARTVLDIVGRPELLRTGAGLRAGEPSELVADVRRLADDVGFVPQMSLEAGLAAAVEWWRSRAEP